MAEYRLSGKYCLFLGATAFVCGWGVMALELLGSRLMAPVFGVGLYVWTSQIAVAMLALGIGYWAGGRMADRRNRPGLLFLIIMTAGLLALMIPYVKETVLESLMLVGLRTGALLSSAALFFIPLFLLGTAVPFVIRLRIDRLDDAGKIVGRVYALSALGSLLGTLVTGFLFLTNLSVSHLILATGCFLVILSGLYWFLFDGKWYAASVLLVVLLPLTYRIELENQQFMFGYALKTHYRAESVYGQIKVTETGSEKSGTAFLTLRLDNAVQNQIDADTGKTVDPYLCYIDYLCRSHNRGGEKALILGAGAGVLPGLFYEHGIECDVVDIDREIVETAERFFGFRPERHNVVIADARYYLYGSKKKYDYIVFDIFQGDVVPGHVISIETFEAAADLLRPGGVAALNIAGFKPRFEDRARDSVVETLQAAFDTVVVYEVGKGKKVGDSRICNYVIIAGGGGMPRSAEPVIDGDYSAYIKEYMNYIPEAERDTESFGRGVVLTDEYNPVDFFSAKISEARRRKELESGTAKSIID